MPRVPSSVASTGISIHEADDVKVTFNKLYRPANRGIEWGHGSDRILVEQNLVVFAPLVLLAHITGVTSAAVGTAAMVYFWARVVHALAYTFAVPWIRTLAFAVGFFAQAVIAWVLLVR